ncbi:MAG: homoserine dehydrogenase [Candidatus Izemoplasma sp.]|nr:homoserine dehydrogenase [Candidatus Izemoplasma sp.]
MNVALLGLGVVGKGVYDILTELHPDINISYVLDRNEDLIKDLDTKRAKNIDEIVNDRDVDVVIELIGGKTSAYDFIKQSLQKGKHVVTANKAVISDYFDELHQIAKRQQVSLRYEASVGGGIIILNPLSQLRNVNPVTEISGIINGSTNFILSKIFLEDYTYEDAYAEALSLGYIETGSTDDMDGLDLMRKINILSMMSYGQLIDEKDINLVPLSMISKKMIDYVKEQGKTIKYTAFSSLKDGDITISLEPVIMELTDPLGMINYEENAITIKGKHHKFQTFIGLGAGRYPTGSAVVYDLLQLQNHIPFNVSATDLGYTINQKPVQTQYLIETKDGFHIKEKTTLKALLEDDTIISFAGLEW